MQPCPVCDADVSYTRISCGSQRCSIALVSISTYSVRGTNDPSIMECHLRSDNLQILIEKYLKINFFLK